MGETHEKPHHNLVDFEPCLRYATEGQAVGGIPMPNILEGVGGEDYAFANLEELFLVPNIITPPKFKVLDFDKYKGTTCP